MIHKAINRCGEPPHERESLKCGVNLASVGGPYLKEEASG